MFKERLQSGRRGFTLIELIVVVIIIGILAAIATVAYNGYVFKSHHAAVLATSKNLSDSLKAYALDGDATSESLVASELAAVANPSDPVQVSAAITRAAHLSASPSYTFTPDDLATPATIAVADGVASLCVVLDPPAIVDGPCAVSAAPAAPAPSTMDIALEQPSGHIWKFTSAQIAPSADATVVADSEELTVQLAQGWESRTFLLTVQMHNNVTMEDVSYTVDITPPTYRVSLPNGVALILVQF